MTACRVLLPDGDIFHCRVADTPQLRFMGLRYIETLPTHCGLLMLFSLPQQVRITMQDCRMPLDIVWLRDETVVGVIAECLPGSGATYSCDEPADSVLEIPAGDALRHGLRVGTRIIRL